MLNLSSPSYVRLATGTKVSALEGVPTLEDMKIQLARENRYAGGSVEPWPVMLHTFVGMHFVPDYLRTHFLFHDAPEVVGGDCPRPVKTWELSELEEKIYLRILDAHGLHYPNEYEKRVIKHADNCALMGEIHTIAPPGLEEDYADIERVPAAERLVCWYLKEFPPADLADRNGRAGQHFMKLYHEAIGRYRYFQTCLNTPQYLPTATTKKSEA